MAIGTLVSRLTGYYARHGLAATFRRLGLAAKRALVANRMVLFYCDLDGEASRAPDAPAAAAFARKRSYGELSPGELDRMMEVWTAKLARSRMEERFARGASLWTIQWDGQLAGYGWTLLGETIEPHYFPVGSKDAHLFDFHVFSEFRGRGLNPILVRHILHVLSREGVERALIEAAEWNRPQLSSLARTPFRSMGLARKWTVRGRTIVWRHEIQKASAWET